MDAIKNPESWKEIAYWLNIDQLVALILTGSRWMSTVLPRAPLLQADGKYYPLATILSGLTDWKIPEPSVVAPDSNGVISFPPHLRSLSLSLLTRPSAPITGVNLPASLTSLTINDATYHYWADRWKIWTAAIRSLTELRSLSIAGDYLDRFTGRFDVLDGLYPHLTSLTIGKLNNSSGSVFDSLLPVSLTQLSITSANPGGVGDLEDVVPTLTNLTSLTLPFICFEKPDHYTVRHLPHQLRELVIVNDAQPLSGYLYYIPVDVLSELPRTITALDVAISLPDNKTLESLEQLPLTSVKLRAELDFVRYGNQLGQFWWGNFPTLKQLELTNFKTIKVPASVTSLYVAGAPFGSVDLTTTTNLQTMVITDYGQLTDRSRDKAFFRQLVNFTMDLSGFSTPVSSFLSWLDTSILQSLTLAVDVVINAVTICEWLADEAKVLTTLVMYSTFDPRFGLTPQTDQELDLPESLTTLNLFFPRSNRLGLAAIPSRIVNLHLDGITVDVNQISRLTKLEHLTIDSEAIIGVVDYYTNSKRSLELQMIRFLLALPVHVAKVVVTRVLLPVGPGLPLPQASKPTVTARYDLYQWLSTGCNRQDVRATIAEMMLTLIPSYTTVLPF